MSFDIINANLKAIYPIRNSDTKGFLKGLFIEYTIRRTLNRGRIFRTVTRLNITIGMTRNLSNHLGKIVPTSYAFIGIVINT